MSKFQEYVPIYEGDRFCLMCGQACPVRRVTKNEATSPHGWALLVSSVQRGLLQWDAHAVDVLYHCADCGNCQGNCATDRPLPYALMAARAEVTRLGKAPASVRALEEKLRAWGNPFGKDDSLRLSGRMKDEESAPVTHHPDVSSRTPRNPNIMRDDASPSPVTLFIGDAAHFLRPQVIDAAEKLLRAVGVAPIRFREGRSSGYLPYAVGLWDTARDFANETARALQESGTTSVVTLSTQDAHALKHVYAELGVALPDAVNVATLAQYLERAGDKLRVTPRAAQAYTYHDPSEAVRLKGHGLAARVLAAMTLGVEPREMTFRENISPAIGTSGGHLFTQPALAEKLARARIQDAQATGAEIIVTDDPLDTVQLEQYADGMQVWNLFEVMAAQVADGSWNRWRFPQMADGGS